MFLISINLLLITDQNQLRFNVKLFGSISLFTLMEDVLLAMKMKTFHDPSNLLFFNFTDTFPFYT